MLNQNEHKKEILESTGEATGLIEKSERTDQAESDILEKQLRELD